MEGQKNEQLDLFNSRQSTLEDKQSLQEQTLTLHGTQLAVNSEKITQTSSEISTLRHQLSSLRELTEDVVISKKDTEEVKVKRIEEVDLSKQQKGKYIYIMTLLI